MGRNLGWAWRPDAPARQAAVSQKSWRKRKTKRWSKRARLCRAPGDVFYSSPQWLALRRKVLLKYGRKCMRCDAVDTEIHVDHIKPRSKRPDLALTFSNLQVLCRGCNMEKSNRHSKDYRRASLIREVELSILDDARRAIG